MSDLINMSEQFSGLPMDSLIGGPLTAACKAQLSLAQATSDFIERVGFVGEEGKKQARTARFAFKQLVTTGEGESQKQIPQDMYIDVPVLSIVNIPSLAIKTVDITFDMEVKSSFEDKSSSDMSASGEASVGWGVFKATLKGSVSSHKEQTRKSDNSAKYHVQVLARDDGISEGLSRVLDIMQSVIAPQKAEQAASQ